GVAVEDQLILPAQQIDIGEGQTDITHTPPRNVLALALLVDFIGRSVDDDQQLGTVGAGELRRLRLPDIFADQESYAKPSAIHDGRLTSGVKVALFIKDLVVGQLGLAMNRSEGAARNEGGGVVNGRRRVLGKADHDTSILPLVAYLLKPRLDL